MIYVVIELKDVALTVIVLAGAAVLVLALIGGWLALLRLSGNIHVVEKGLVYRSGQLSPTELSKQIRKKRLKAVVNLRGKNSDKSWYQRELAVTEAAGITLIDIPLSAHNEPCPETMRTLLEALGRAPRPLLFHCEAGADRAGLAAALYELVWKKRPARSAAFHLSLFYGHIPWFGNKTKAMDRAFWRVADGERQHMIEGH